MVAATRRGQDLPPHPPGEYVDVDGRPVYVMRRGAHFASPSKPTFIIEAACGGYSPMYAWMIESLSQHAQVLAYDRTGLGWSAPGHSAPDGETRARELRALIDTIGLKGPFVLIGHSIAGLYVRIFARRFPEDVSGLVLLDATHTRVHRIFQERPSMHERLRRWAALGSDRLGIARLPFALLTTRRPPWNTLPPAARREIHQLSSTPKTYAAARAESALLPVASAQADQCGLLGDLPLLVITSATRTAEELRNLADPNLFMERWRLLQADLLTLSTRASQRVIHRAGHWNLVTDKRYADQVCAEILRFVLCGPI